MSRFHIDRAMPAHRRSRRRLAGGLALAVALPLLVGGCEGMQVKGASTDLHDDTPIAREVSAALAARPEISRFRIKVTSLGEGTVRLRGRVDSDAQRSTAGQAAAAVPGVRSVMNTLYLNQ